MNDKNKEIRFLIRGLYKIEFKFNHGYMELKVL